MAPLRALNLLLLLFTTPAFGFSPVKRIPPTRARTLFSSSQRESSLPIIVTVRISVPIKFGYDTSYELNTTCNFCCMAIPYLFLITPLCHFLGKQCRVDFFFDRLHQQARRERHFQVS